MKARFMASVVVLWELPVAPIWRGWKKKKNSMEKNPPVIQQSFASNQFEAGDL